MVITKHDYPNPSDYRKAHKEAMLGMGYMPEDWQDMPLATMEKVVRSGGSK